MEKTFKKMTMGFFSILLMSMMLVSAAYPLPFISNNEANVAIVYGANAAATDVTAAQNLVNSLAGDIIIPEEIERILVGGGVTEDEVELGNQIRDGKIRAKLTDNKIPSLFDGKIDWHDGEHSYSYNVHEEILITDSENLRLETTLDNNDLEGVAFINDKGLEYKYVFDDDFNIFGLDNDGAEPLAITILGKEYLIEEIDSDSITVTLAERAIIQEGASVLIDGITLTIDSIYDDAVFVNGVHIREGTRKTVNGIKVKVENIYYRDSDTRPSKVELYYGGTISEEYSNGEAYIGEDDDDPEWVWSIETEGDYIKYIGVRYDLSQVDEEEDVIYEGGEYVFPNDFAIVSFDSLTEVEYHDYEVFFDDNVDLYEIDDSNDKGYNKSHNDVDVVIIKGENDNSFELSEDIETDTLYLYQLEDNTVEIYYRDVVDDFDGKPIFYKSIDAIALQVLADEAQVLADETDAIALQVLADEAQDDDIAADEAQVLADLTDAMALQDLADEAQVLADETDAIALQVLADEAQDDDDEAVVAQALADSCDLSIAKLIADETDMEISISSDGTSLFIIGDNSNIEISLNESFTCLGTDDEEAESNDVIVNGIFIGKKENDVMDHYGTIIENPEDNADEDRVVLKIPSEQVYAQISVLGSEADSIIIETLRPTPAELNITKITDGQVGTAIDKNIIVVGGPCINTVAASLLGGKSCGVEFTAKTGVGMGQVLIQTFDRGDGNIATLVAGYNAADTQRGVVYLLNNNPSIAIGDKVII